MSYAYEFCIIITKCNHYFAYLTYSDHCLNGKFPFITFHTNYRSTDTPQYYIPPSV